MFSINGLGTLFKKSFYSLYKDQESQNLFTSFYELFDPFSFICIFNKVFFFIINYIKDIFL